MSVSDDNMWWAGGHFDGDGCIAVHYGGLTLVIAKSTNPVASANGTLNGQEDVISAVQRMIEKKKQAEIVLGLSAGNCVQAKAALHLLHGHKRKVMG